EATASAGDTGSSRPPHVRNQAALAAGMASRSWTDLERRHATSEQPAALANASPLLSAVCCELETQLPLWMTARANRPRISGEASCAHTDQPPADSPSM